jgi:hypothetical protein
MTTCFALLHERSQESKVVLAHRPAPAGLTLRNDQRPVAVSSTLLCSSTPSSSGHGRESAEKPEMVASQVNSVNARLAERGNGWVGDSTVILCR